MSMSKQRERAGERKKERQETRGREEKEGKRNGRPGGREIELKGVQKMDLLKIKFCFNLILSIFTYFVSHHICHFTSRQ